MNDVLYRRLMVALTAFGILTTAALIAVTVYLYRNCSIISFIANGR